MGPVLDISSQGSQWQQSEMLGVPTEHLKRDRSWSGGNRLMMRKSRHGATNTNAPSPPSSYHPPQQELITPTSPSSHSPLSGTTSPASTTSSTSPRHAPTSPSFQRHLSPDEGDSVSEIGEQQRGPIPISVVLSTSSTSTTNTLPSVQSNSASFASVSGAGRSGGLDPLQEHYVTSYSNSELRTFHCDKVRKMPLSGLDPSMLLGFLCKDVREWEELRRGIEDVSSFFHLDVCIYFPGG
jgi:cysteine protease ATG4